MTTRRHLAMCPSCARHVRVDESACPFCQASLSDEFRATPPRPRPAVRLSRAALYAFGVGALSLSAAQGCGGETGSGGDKDGGSRQEGSTAGPDAAVHVPDSGADGSADAPADAPSDGPVDAPSDTGNVERPDGMPAPPYGGVPGG
jgi:hypothetical protein